MTVLAIAPPTIQLRDYQETAVEAVFNWIYTKEGNPLVVIPTGGGKSLIISETIRRARALAAQNQTDCNVLVLAMQSELIKQNVKAAALLNPRHDIGIYNAKLKQREIAKPITVASIQSLVSQSYARAWDVVVIDECHQLANHSTGQYRTFLAAQRLQNPHLLVIGFTATPYKLSSGRLDQGKDAIFAGIAHETNVLELIERNFLSRPVTPRLADTFDLSGVHLRGGEYIAKELSSAVDVEAVNARVCDEIVARGVGRSHWVVFAVDVDHVLHLTQALTERGIVAAAIHGGLATDERAYRLDAFDRGEIQCLVGCEILTTGWDCIHVSLVALCRPTKSAGLYVQMAGRGLRIAPGKTDCLILDFSNLITTFGSLDRISVRDKTQGDGTGEAVVKVCPTCEEWIAAGRLVCPSCGHEFPPAPVVLNAAPSTAPILSTDRTPTWHTVESVDYVRHEPKPPKVTPTMRVIYSCGFRNTISEYVCIQHEGFARTKADRWWRERSPESTTPLTIERALMLAEDLKTPVRIATLPQKDNPRYSEIVAYEWPADARKHAQLGLPRVCWSCGWFDALLSHCARWNGTPDEATHATGCPEWKDDEPALPF